MNPINDDDIALDLRPVMVILKDGTVKRIFGQADAFVPPSLDAATGVTSKDVLIDATTNLTVRLYRPSAATAKLPILVYFHGGAFVIGSAFSAVYQPFLTSISSKANILIVSVDYRLAPEHKIPAAYDDSWQALKWVTSHAVAEGGEPWLAPDEIDYKNIFLAGDSAGGNIAHNMAMKAGSSAGSSELHGLDIKGAALLHPYFWGAERLAREVRGEGWGEGVITPESCDKMWWFVTGGLGNDDPRINPMAAAEGLRGLGCRRVVVMVAERDTLVERGKRYGEELGRSGWGGEVVVRETKGEDHVFFLFNPGSDKTGRLMGDLVEFFRR